MNKIIIGCSLSKCIHVWGVHRFLSIAKMLGYKTYFIGPALTTNEIMQYVKKINPDYIAISYRLTPETGQNAIKEFIKTVRKEGLKSKKFVFGGTTLVAEIVRKFYFFDMVFDGKSDYQDVVRYLKGIKNHSKVVDQHPQNLIERMKVKKPYPIIRHHFGLPTMSETIKGIEKISEAEVLDVICLGTDQDAQENFFNPKLQNPGQKGAGGVPVRNDHDFSLLYQATRTGNLPLMRTYAGTKDLIRLAEIYYRTINICSAGIPIFWYNRLDGRGPMGLEESIYEHQKTIEWHGNKNIPVEILDPHQWAMRGAHDVIFVVSAYISAFISKFFGVKYYIAQLMFNSPAEESFKMDLAKMLAVLEMIEPLKNSDFFIYKMTRTGLLSFPTDEDEAKGHLASSTMLQLAIDPDIIHVVSYCEANRISTHKEVIKSCKIVKRVIDNSMLNPFPDMKNDPEVLMRKEYLIKESKVLLNAIIENNRYTQEPWFSPTNLCKCVKLGILDAPQLKMGDIAKGTIKTHIIKGGVEAIDTNGNVLNESLRINQIKDLYN